MQLIYKRKNKADEILSKEDTEKLNKISDAFESEPVKYLNMRKMTIRARLRKGQFYFDIPEVIMRENKEIGFYHDYGVNHANGDAWKLASTMQYMQ
jgi:hypothetical protein